MLSHVLFSFAFRIRLDTFTFSKAAMPGRASKQSLLSLNRDFPFKQILIQN